MTDTASAPPIDPGPPPPAPPGLPTASERFFSWTRGLGVVRADGWLGGVCGGLAARLRIDPIIVRGIFVVVALLGFPALLVYAIAWALLPDTGGRIHLRELFHGRYDPAMTGVFILAIVGFVPVVPWLRNVLLWPLWALTGFAPWAWDDGSGVSALGVVGFVLGLALIGGLVYLIVRSARADRPARADARMASALPVPPAASDSGVDAAKAPLGGDVDSAGRAPAGSTSAAATVTAAAALAAADATAHSAPTTPLAVPPAAEPTAPGPLADDAEVARWRATHDAWREQSDAWRRSQQHAERAAREQARREREAAGAAFAAEAEERRRIRRATKPRTSFIFVLTALGVAIVTGAIAVLVALADAATAPFAAAIGLLAAAIVTALAMVLAGAARRRSGFLASVTIVLLVVGLITAVASGPRSLALGHVSLGTSTAPVSITQPFGTTDIWIGALSDTGTITAGSITIRKGTGDTYIVVNPGTVLDLEATLGGGGIQYSRIDADTGELLEEGVVSPHDAADGGAEWDWSARSTGSSEAHTRQRVTLDQAVGSVYVTIYDQEGN